MFDNSFSACGCFLFVCLLLLFCCCFLCVVFVFIGGVGGGDKLAQLIPLFGQD